MTATPFPLWLAARDAAARAALNAWRAIEPLYHGEYSITDKVDGPCTEADRMADRMIVEELKAAFPEAGHAFLTEESEDDTARLAARHVWIIDPIDGTKDFIKKNGNFAIHIALVERDEAGAWVPVAGVVYRPVAGHMYSAVRGGGAWLADVTKREEGTPDGMLKGGLDFGQGDAIHVSERVTMESMRSVVSNSHRDSKVTRLIASLPLEGYWHIGSLGIKLCQIAEGSAELYVNLGLGKTKEWDTCAPLLILNEAGGVMTDLDGSELKYNQAEVRHMRGLLASNGPRQGDFLASVHSFLLAESAREASQA